MFCVQYDEFSEHSSIKGGHSPPRWVLNPCLRQVFYSWLSPLMEWYGGRPFGLQPSIIPRVTGMTIICDVSRIAFRNAGNVPCSVFYCWYGVIKGIWKYRAYALFTKGIDSFFHVVALPLKHYLEIPYKYYHFSKSRFREREKCSFGNATFPTHPIKDNHARAWRLCDRCINPNLACGPNPFPMSIKPLCP